MIDMGDAISVTLLSLTLTVFFAIGRQLRMEKRRQRDRAEMKRRYQ